MTKVLLEIDCFHLTSPKTQLPKFEGTLEEGFWEQIQPAHEQKQENAKFITSRWVREFQTGKKLKQIIKSTKNQAGQRGQG